MILHPWDFPGKSTRVGCHFLLQGIFPTQGLNPGLSHCRQMLYHLSHQGSPKMSCCCQDASVVSDSVRPHGLQPTRLLHLWDSPGKNNGVDCHFLLQGIFPTQGSNPGLPHCRQMLYRLSHQGSSGHKNYLKWINMLCASGGSRGESFLVFSSF